MKENQVKRFVWKLLLLLFPFTLVLGYPLFVILMSGETIPVTIAAKLQQGSSKDFLYGPAFRDKRSAFKLYTTLLCKPKILILGTSRVMQFRQPVFLSRDVYNAGGGVTYLWEYKKFLQALPSEQKPKILIMGLDQWQFNEHWKPEKFREEVDEWGNLNAAPVMNMLFNKWKEIYKYYFQGRISSIKLFSNLFEFRGIGLSAVVENRGFRRDGSYRYAEMNQEKWEKRFEDAFDRIEKGSDIFTYAKDIDQNRVSILKDFLNYCHEEKIEVIAFLPPFSSEVYERLKDKEQGYAYIFKIHRELEPLFHSHHFTFCDFTNLAWLHASDEETIDGFHGSEKAYLRILIELC